MSKRLTHCEKLLRTICEQAGLEEGCEGNPELRKHLETCPNCAAYVQSIRTTIRLYKKYPCPNLSTGARERLHTLLEKLPPPKSARKAR